MWQKRFFVLEGHEFAYYKDEAAYQTMWKAYFQAVTIPERRNLKLHLRHVPKRYWPYLTEKQPAVPLVASAAAPVPRAAVPASGPRPS